MGMQVSYQIRSVNLRSLLKNYYIPPYDDCFQDKDVGAPDRLLFDTGISFRVR